MPTMCEAPDWPGHRDIWTWFWEGATTIYSSISLPFYCGFQSSSYRALLGCWRHSFTATVYLWFQRVVIQKQSHRKLPTLFLKSSTLKAFIWDTGCHGAKNEEKKKYNIFKWSPIKWTWQTEIRKKSKNKQTENHWLLKLLLDTPSKHLSKKKSSKNFPPFKINYKVTGNRIWLCLRIRTICVKTEMNHKTLTHSGS